MTTSIIVILVWEFICYGFYLRMKDFMVKGLDPHRPRDLRKKIRTEEEIIDESMALGGLCGAMAMAPFVHYALI